MNIPGPASLLFLFYLLVFLPWVSFRSRKRLKASEGGGVSRTAIWTGTLASQTVLLAFAWWVGRGFGFDIFPSYAPQPKHLVAALCALAACFVLRIVNRAMRSPAERKAMAVYRWAPRTAKEWMSWALAVLMASVAEEAAYRGVGMSILWYATDDVWIAGGVSALAFALAHATQGWKSALFVFAIGVLMQVVVVYSGVLILAMIVHAIYDLVTGYLIGRAARAYDAA